MSGHLIRRRSDQNIMAVTALEVFASSIGKRFRFGKFTEFFLNPEMKFQFPVVGTFDIDALLLSACIWGRRPATEMLLCDLLCPP